MKFLEARRILASFEGGPPLDFLLGMSGQPEPLLPFLQAAAAERGFEARVRTLPFNTLTQTLHVPPEDDETEVFLLFPWDLLPELDWRSGFPEAPRSLHELLEDARAVMERIRSRKRPPLLYVASPIPEVLPNHHASRAIDHHLRAIVEEVGGDVFPGDAVSLESLFRSGSPLASSALGSLARGIITAVLERRPSSGKVLVTDFDNTLWHGVVGEDGVDGLHFSASGLGFIHFVYQTFIKRLKRAGVLIAGVTKNDPDLATAPLEAEGSVLVPNDFVSILASYNAKSSQIEELARQLNLGLDSFVFVDDNPVELAEVGKVLPDIRLVQFPRDAAELPRMISELSRFFHREELSDEDRERTELYRRRVAGLVPKDVRGADLKDFLKGLEMRLTVRDRSEGDRQRAVQLINKTNQFNLNGIRVPDDEVETLLADGGRLFTASLSDRHGSHGEILSCLVDGDGTIRSLVMSCRVFQRRVEYAFLVWLSDRLPSRTRLAYVETERNEPLRRFLRDPAFAAEDDGVTLDLEAFARAHRDDLALFDIESP